MNSAESTRTSAHKKYTIGVTRPSPSMSRDYHQIECDTYADAVQIAQEVWKEKRETVTLHSGTDTTYWYHYIAADGGCTDRNKNSGVPETAKLS